MQNRLVKNVCNMHPQYYVNYTKSTSNNVREKPYTQL